LWPALETGTPICQHPAAMKPRPKPDPLSAFDGRVRRGVRSREAIVAALMDLVGSGVLQPTVQQVAERAGVGVRSVFRHFTEMETLHRAMDARLEAEARPLLGGPERTGTLAERVQTIVRQRAAFFERIAPYKRSGNLVRWRSSFLQDRHLTLQRLMRADMLRWFPELDGASAPVIEAIDLATSFEAWERLRFDRQLGPKAAMSVVETAIHALLRDAGVKPAVVSAARAAGAQRAARSRARR
jgi:AcrR family transcriptional regulator